ncbi:MAG TPA: hypothetical protein VLJ58_01000 [Ramlibacter sp.]|nr:hypothetical protein [Ramlibacter sp.]
MRPELRSAIDVWKQADANAQAAEKRLAEQWQKYCAKGPEATNEMASEVRRLRSMANERLAAALSLMKPDGRRNEGPAS